MLSFALLHKVTEQGNALQLLPKATMRFPAAAESCEENQIHIESRVDTTVPISTVPILENLLEPSGLRYKDCTCTENRGTPLRMRPFMPRRKWEAVLKQRHYTTKMTGNRGQVLLHANLIRSFIDLSVYPPGRASQAG